MKMNILGIFAIVIALGLSAFTAPAKSASKRGMGDYWFTISSVAVGSPVPQSAATFIQQSVSEPTGTCPSGSSHQCVSGFTPSQVNTSTNQLKGTQSPDVSDQFKN